MGKQDQYGQYDPYSDDEYYDEYADDPFEIDWSNHHHTNDFYRSFSPPTESEYVDYDFSHAHHHIDDGPAAYPLHHVEHKPVFATQKPYDAKLLFGCNPNVQEVRCSSPMCGAYPPVASAPEIVHSLVPNIASYPDKLVTFSMASGHQSNTSNVNGSNSALPINAISPVTVVTSPSQTAMPLKQPSLAQSHSLSSPNGQSMDMLLAEDQKQIPSPTAPSAHLQPDNIHSQNRIDGNKLLSNTKFVTASAGGAPIQASYKNAHILEMM